MVSCNNIIGIRGVCSSDDEQTSPFYYINDLPGISLKKAANVSDQETGTGINLLQKSIDLGIDQAKGAIINSLLQVVKFGAVNLSALSGALQIGSYIERATAEGQVIKMNSCTRLQSIYLPYVNVLIRDSASVVISILDLGITKSYTYDVIGGRINQIPLQYKSNGKVIEVRIKNADDSPIFVSDAGLLFDQGNCSCDCLELRYCNTTSTTNDGKSNGLQILVQTICDEDALFCEIAKFAAKASWYASGVWFLEELLASDRLNIYTTYQQDEAADQIARWTEKYNEQLEGLTQRIVPFLLKLDPCCVECNTSTWKYAMP